MLLSPWGGRRKVLKRPPEPFGPRVCARQVQLIIHSCLIVLRHALRSINNCQLTKQSQFLSMLSKAIFYRQIAYESSCIFYADMICTWFDWLIWLNVSKYFTLMSHQYSLAPSMKRIMWDLKKKFSSNITIIQIISKRNNLAIHLRMCRGDVYIVQNTQDSSDWWIYLIRANLEGPWAKHWSPNNSSEAVQWPKNVRLKNYVSMHISVGYLFVIRLLCGPLFISQEQVSEDGEEALGYCLLPGLQHCLGAWWTSLTGYHLSLPSAQCPQGLLPETCPGKAVH